MIEQKVPGRLAPWGFIILGTLPIAWMGTPMILEMKLVLSLVTSGFVFLSSAQGAETPPAADRAAVVEGDNTFALDLYGQLRHHDGNLFFSPASISTALAMAYAGARGDTASEMAETLHFTLPPAQLHPAIGALLGDLNGAHDGYQLSVANALWAQRGSTFLEDFLKIMNTDYGAGLNQVDFKTATEAARQTINRWVEQKTQDKIKDLLQPGVLQPSTRLVLTNAIYFKGDWQTQFDKAQTRTEDFHASPATTLQVPLMHREGGFNYLKDPTFQALEIPYKNKQLSMIIFLPNDSSGLTALEQLLTASNTQQWLRQLAPVSKVIVTIPKFKMTQEFELGGTLSAMGMPEAFTGSADFSAMTGSRDFAISAVIHKAYVDVNEEGTEAAAATAVTMRALAIRLPDQPPPVFRADHPFVFLIRDNRSNSILFMGRVANPAN
jgi:serpin B